MPYWGKIVGAASGLATGTTWLALIGLILGHQFDRGFADGFARLRRDRRPGDPLTLPAGFVEALFESAGFLAKADGRVSEEEIRAARVVMHKLALGPEQVREAIASFERGKRPDWPVEDTLLGVRRGTESHKELRPLFVRLLLEIALAKKALHRSERAALWTVCRALGVSRVELAQLEALLRAQQAFGRSQPPESETPGVRSAYAVLGVSQASSEAEIKQAYRRLMNKHHPDKLGMGSDAAAIRAAEQRTRQIRSAYEMLRQRRRVG